MHKRELNIIVNKEDNAIKRGEFFEEIVSNIFKTQRYVTGIMLKIVIKKSSRSYKC